MSPIKRSISSIHTTLLIS